jgi:hypothetical protein
MTIEEKDSRFYIAASPIPGAGKGLFAKVPLAENDTLEVIGVLIPSHSISDECTYYADAYKFRVGNDLLIPTGYGGIANHSSSPNMEKLTIGERVYLRALRPIEVGEELLYVYSRYAQEQFGISIGTVSEKPLRGRNET